MGYLKNRNEYCLYVLNQSVIKKDIVNIGNIVASKKFQNIQHLNLKLIMKENHDFRNVVYDLEKADLLI